MKHGFVHLWRVPHCIKDIEGSVVERVYYARIPKRCLVNSCLRSWLIVCCLLRSSLCFLLRYSLMAKNRGKSGHVKSLHSLKLTVCPYLPLKIDHPKRKFIFQPPIFRCENVSFREGTAPGFILTHFEDFAVVHWDGSCPMNWVNIHRSSVLGFQS